MKRMKRMSGKLLSALLVLVMFAGIFPMSAFAIEWDEGDPEHPNNIVVETEVGGGAEPIQLPDEWNDDGTINIIDSQGNIIGTKPADNTAFDYNKGEYVEIGPPKGLYESEGEYVKPDSWTQWELDAYFNSRPYDPKLDGYKRNAAGEIVDDQGLIFSDSFIQALDYPDIYGENIFTSVSVNVHFDGTPAPNPVAAAPAGGFMGIARASSLPSVFPDGKPVVAEVRHMNMEFSNKITGSQIKISPSGAHMYSYRYLAFVRLPNGDTVAYECYCCDPILRGPESGGDSGYNLVYDVSHLPYHNILKNGYSNNMTNVPPGSDLETRLNGIWRTRIAIGMVRHGQTNVKSIAGAGTAQRQIDDSHLRAATELFSRPFDLKHDNELYPRVYIERNGVKYNTNPGSANTRVESTEGTMNGTTFNSESFMIENLTSGVNTDNYVSFLWLPDTKDGTELLLNGSSLPEPVIYNASAPDGDVAIKYLKMFNTAKPEYSFAIPNATRGDKAGIAVQNYLWEVQDKSWMVRHPAGRDGVPTTNVSSGMNGQRQDMVFYIPPMGVEFMSIVDDIPPMSLTIEKVDATGRRINGAVFRIYGPIAPGEPMDYDETRTYHINTGRMNAGRFSIDLVDGPYGLWPDGRYILWEEEVPANMSAPVRHWPIIIENSGTEHMTATPDRFKITNYLDESTDTSIRIQKIDALTREPIPGALVRIYGMSAAYVTLPDGQIISFNNTGVNASIVLSDGANLPLPSDGISWQVEDGLLTGTGLPYGMYMVYEERAPENYSLLPQHTAYGFFLAPPDVTVTATIGEDLTFNGSANQNEVKVNITLGDFEYDSGGGGSSTWSWTGSFTVPADMIDGMINYGFSSSSVPNSVLVTFENYPFGTIEVNKFCMVTGIPLMGTHFRIQGYFPEGNTNGMPIQRVGETGADGKVIFDNLPAGHYTITEIEASQGWQLSQPSFQGVDITWGQTASISFFNKNKTYLTVIKVDALTGLMLPNAVFRLTDPTSGEFWEGTTDANGRVSLGIGEADYNQVGSLGSQLKDGMVYILTEVMPPPGYAPNPNSYEIVLSGNNLPNEITITNYELPKLTIIKYDELTGERLQGAHFRVRKTEAETWNDYVTDDNGEIRIEELDEGIYSIWEHDAPWGYFADPERREILLEGGDDKTLEFFNRPRPELFIYKHDAITGEPIPHTKFLVTALEGFTIGEFETDDEGKIVISWRDHPGWPGGPGNGYLLEERIYRVTELLPPANYLLSNETPNVNNSIGTHRDVQAKWWERTELNFHNILKPTLIFDKVNAMTGRGVSNTRFRVEWDGPNGGIVNLGNYLTQCGLVVIPFVEPGWYTVTEIGAAPGMTLASPPNNVRRIYLAPGANSYTYAQTSNGLYADPRTVPSNWTGPGTGPCECICGYLCWRYCGNNCMAIGEGGHANPNNPGYFGGINVNPGTMPDSASGGGTAPDTTMPLLSQITAERTSETTALISFRASKAGHFGYVRANVGSAAPGITAGQMTTALSAGPVHMEAVMVAGQPGVVYVRMRDAAGNLSNTISVQVPRFEAPVEPPDTMPPVLSAGSAIRSSSTAATVAFTSSEAGTYDYRVVTYGATQPTFEVTTGYAAVAGVNSINVTGIENDEHKDIWIRVRDASGNTSGYFRVIIPEWQGPPVAPVLSNPIVTKREASSVTITFSSDASGNYWREIGTGAGDLAMLPSDARVLFNGSNSLTIEGISSGATHVRIQGSNTGGISNILEIPVDAWVDTVVPVATLSITGVNSTDGWAWLSWTINKSGTFYWLVQPSSSPAPSAATLKSIGTSFPVTSATPFGTIVADSLSAGSYVAYVMLEDAAGTMSAVASGSFTVTGAPVKPILSNGATTGRTGVGSAGIRFDSDSTGWLFIRVTTVGGAPAAVNPSEVSATPVTVGTNTANVTIPSGWGNIPVDVHVAVRNSSGVVSDWLKISPIPAFDDLIPAFSAASAVRDSDLTATLTFTLNKNAVVNYLVVDAPFTEPSVPAVKAGPSYSATAGANTLNIGGLPSGAKRVYMIASDTVGNESALFYIDVPAYVIPDTTAPVLSQTSAPVRTGNNTATVFFQSDEDQTRLWYQITSSGAPSTMNPALITGTPPLGLVYFANTEASVALADLVSMGYGTVACTIHIYGADASGNVSNLLSINIPAPAVAAPVLSNGRSVRTGGSSATIWFKSTAAGEYYYVIDEKGASGSVTFSGSGIPVADVSKDIILIIPDSSVMTDPDKEYEIHILLVGSTGLDSNVLSIPIDKLADTSIEFDSIFGIKRLSDTTGSITFKTNENGTYYLVVRDDVVGLTPVFRDSIIASPQATGPVTSGVDVTVPLTGLNPDPGIQEYVYLVFVATAGSVASPVTVGLIPNQELPVITVVSGTRTGTTASVKFKMNVPGTYFYAVAPFSATVAKEDVINQLHPSGAFVAQGFATYATALAEQDIAISGLVASEDYVLYIIGANKEDGRFGESLKLVDMESDGTILFSAGLGGRSGAPSTPPSSPSTPSTPDATPPESDPRIIYLNPDFPTINVSFGD